MTNQTEDRAKEQAAAQYSSIVDMLAAVECDYDRLQELRDEREELTREYQRLASSEYATDEERKEASEALTTWMEENADELEELEAAAGDCTDEEDARQRIQEDPLSVKVRSDWASPGEPLEAGEFRILLCTGGPAVRIVGELDQYGTPCRGRAWLEYQDWGTPWTQYFGASSDMLCQYASHFFFGE